MCNKQMHSMFYNKVKNSPLLWKMWFPKGKREVQFKINTFICCFALFEWMNNVCVLKRKIMRNRISQQSGTETAASFNISLISINI